MERLKEKLGDMEKIQKILNKGKGEAESFIILEVCIDLPSMKRVKKATTWMIWMM